jgi:hypothetical protein
MTETLDGLRGQLTIDPDDLHSGLVQQPDLFYNVSESFAAAVSRRDEQKLVLEELTAELDQLVRKGAAEREEKTTEASIHNRLRGMPKIQTAERAFLKARLDADMWQALKEAFQQRSFMLRELVSLKLRQMETISLEHGAGAQKRALGDAVERQNNAKRADRWRR